MVSHVAGLGFPLGENRRVKTYVLSVVSAMLSLHSVGHCFKQSFSCVSWYWILLEP